MEKLIRAFVQLLVVKATKKENKLKNILKNKSTDFILLHLIKSFNISTGSFYWEIKGSIRVKKLFGETI